MLGDVFVGRQPELDRLEQFLRAAAGGQAQVVFIAGEAGAGKSALVHEFVRRAEEADATVVSALGECNARTGAGDPYLPFREVLQTLTGAGDDKQAVNTITATNASRLRELLRVSGETLLTVGPDLIGIFVPGASLLAKVVTSAALKGNLSDRLSKQIGAAVGAAADKSKASESAGNPALDQSKIFEQYSTVIKALAKEHTLLLVLDDLQWADSGSLDLLFHLARGLKDSHVLLLGTYRPDDVAIGQGDQRHPLAPILNELRRYNGDIVIDLTQSSTSEGRAFVDALVDAESNRLDATFRKELFARTDGHPLFTVELLHHLQERGDLVKDADGRWTPCPALNWDALPARVEGVIAERIARLSTDLRETLTDSSVMGYDFIAQVVARVQNVRERDLVKSLSRELDKRYRLVSEQGEVKLGSTFLSVYRFAHIVFQQFLYGELSAAERRLLHADVAEALEALYAGRTDDIAVQLAHHYLQAGDDEKASGYLICAGDAAVKVYAFPEARLHYAQALEMLARLPDSADNRRRRVDTLIKQAHAVRAGGPQKTLESMRQAEALLENLNEGSSDRLRRARVDNWIGQAYLQANQMPQALAYMQRVLPVAQELHDPELLAVPASTIGNVLALQGRFDQAEPLLDQALPLLERVENSYDWILSTGCRAMALVERGRVTAGLAAAQAGLVRVTAMKTATGIAIGHAFLALSHYLAGNWTRALEHAQLGLDVATAAGDQLVMYVALGRRAMAHVKLGDFQAADQDAAQWQAIANQIGGRLVYSELYAVSQAEAALGQNRIEEALILAEQAGKQSQVTDNIFSEGLARRIQGEAQARLQPPRWEGVESHMAESVRLFTAGDARLEVARTHVAWGNALARRSDARAAREHYSLAAAQYEASGLEGALAEVRERMPEL